MAPLPKRRHSSRRQAKRTRALSISTVMVTKCANCSKPTQPHRVCPECGYYNGKQVVFKKQKKSTKDK